MSSDVNPHLLIPHVCLIIQPSFGRRVCSMIGIFIHEVIKRHQSQQLPVPLRELTVGAVP